MLSPTMHVMLVRIAAKVHTRVGQPMIGFLEDMCMKTIFSIETSCIIVNLLLWCHKKSMTTATTGTAETKEFLTAPTPLTTTAQRQRAPAVEEETVTAFHAVEDIPQQAKWCIHQMQGYNRAEATGSISRHDR